ncbi:restriction endonuclease subunit S [Bacteroides fragilis]|uniref:restriction endonuclease subunit S n=1 Tax=Bacteroides fragilis TaxID=817 RepID=UPI0022AB1AB1|nr:restriction endonuclease subunit S [Bacteroides fragilis]MCZ2626999.1 restriction endonuclease subunit S [Bacteroides fragilis]
MAIDNKDKKILNVPPLRFPEFTEEWKAEQLDNIATLSKGIGISKEQLSEDGEPCILYGELYTKYKSEIIKQVESKTDINGSKLKRSKANDVIIPCSGETAVDIATARCVPFDNILFGGDLNVISLHQYDGAFMSYQLNGKRKYDIARVAQGVSIVHLYGEHLKAIKTYNPTLPEQQKIAKLLSLLDDRIDTQNKIIEDLKKLKSAIVDKLYSSTNGKTYSFCQLFEVVNEKNKKLAYKNVLSASQELGMIERSNINIDIKFEQESISGYKIVRKGDYVVHLRSFQGGFAFSDTTGICSPAYTILRPNDLVVYGYLSHFFTSKPFIKSLKLVTYGIRDGRSINVDEWLDMPILLPSAQEQMRILTIVNAIDAKLHNEAKVQFCLSSQKSYLLNTMFI